VQASPVSPLPNFLSLSENNQVKLLDFWQPIIEAISGEDETIAFSAESILIFDLTTNKTLYEKNTKEKLAMASLTKIMTAIVALENKKPDDRYVVRAEYLVGENTMGLEKGEVLSLEELLYGLILHSGNDAAETLAGSFPGGKSAFVVAMNNKAKALGAEQTVFSNPSGLQGDGSQLSTAYDLLVITRYALEAFPLFRKVSETYEYTIPQTTTHKEYVLTNETNLLSSYPGVKGVKTGYTPEAGLCLVTYLDHKGHKLIGILLNSENRRQEMKDLLDLSLTSLGIKPPEHE